MGYAQKHGRALLVGAFLLLGLTLPSGAYAQEIIDSFASDITIRADGSVLVTEHIVYDFGSNERHGIFRTLESKHPQDASAWYKTRFIEYEIVRALRDGTPEPYELEGDRDELLVRIGDAEVTMSGAHAYTIEYIMRGALSYDTAEGVELYYNATGNEWEVPIMSARIMMHDPDGLLRDERSCYRGTVGSTETCAASSTEEGMLYSGEELRPYEGVTIAQAVDATKVARQVRERLDTLIALVALLPFTLLWLFWFGRKVYLHERFYRSKSVVVAQYEPYPQVLPVYSGILLDGQLDPRDIAAGIIYLAEQGYIRIRKTNRKAFFVIELDDYEIELLKRTDSDMPESGAAILSLMFDGNAVGEKVTLSSIKGDTAKQQANYRKTIAIRRAADADLVRAGFYEPLSFAQFRNFALLALMSLGLLAVTAFFEPIVAIILGALCLLVYVVSIFVLWRRRTQKGYEALFHLRGFKLFLSVTDAERFAFHNAPAKSPELFMQYLPYAIAFGVEKEWAEVFKNITLPQPSWYDGGQHGAFSAVMLSQSLNGFSSALASAGASSASSGGGSSGGGGGGGGGGSW